MIASLAQAILLPFTTEFIENSDKIYDWRQIFLTNSKNSQGVVFHKFYNKKIYNQAIKEYKKFVEQITGKKVLIGCPSRMSWGIEALGVFNNPNAYKDIDCILIGHGKGSSLITDITSPNAWRFSDNNKSVWEFIEKHANNKKIMTLVCEVDGVKLANKTELDMIDRSGFSG